MKTIITAISILSLITLTNFKNIEKVNPKKRRDYIPDAKTAIKVAEVILSPIYGEETVSEAKPFNAQLKGDFWLVTNTVAPGQFGGVVTVEIRKSDCKILLAEISK